MERTGRYKTPQRGYKQMALPRNWLQRCASDLHGSGRGIFLDITAKKLGVIALERN
jgi:hypothetical protein